MMLKNTPEVLKAKHQKIIKDLDLAILRSQLSRKKDEIERAMHIGCTETAIVKKEVFDLLSKVRELG